MFGRPKRGRLDGRLTIRMVSGRENLVGVDSLAEGLLDSHAGESGDNFDLAELAELFHETSQYRNCAAHETRMSFVEARRLRDRWLGVATRDGGIFGALLPTNG